MNAKRALAIGISCLFIFILLFSHLFILAEADHDCSGEDCSICEMIAIVEKTLQGISLLICTATIAVPALVVAIKLHGVSVLERSRFTPILLKVKLTN